VGSAPLYIPRDLTLWSQSWHLELRSGKMRSAVTEDRALQGCNPSAGDGPKLPSASELHRAIPEPVRRLYPGDRSPRPVKRSPFDGRPNIAARPLPAPQLPEAAAGLPMPGTLLGNWQGKGLLPKRGICTLLVELRGESAEGGPVVAYSTLQCINMAMLMPGARPMGAKPITPEEAMAATGRLNPVSAILSGMWANGSVKFHVDKTIGASDGCALESATITSFGARQIAFEGQDGGSCGKWEMLLAKGGM
jgi:hypothetical protein